MFALFHDGPLRIANSTPPRFVLHSATGRCDTFQARRASRGRHARTRETQTASKKLQPHREHRMSRHISFSILSLALLFCAASTARAQEASGPAAPPPKFEVKRIPSVPHPGPPPIPVEVIIQKFSANENVMKK